MKTLQTTVAAVLLALTASQGAQANDPVFFKDPINFAGTGCPAGSVAAVGAGSDTLSLLFDSYVADPGNKSCSFAVPVHVPQGWQVSTMTADWRGFVQGKGELRRKYFFAGGLADSKVDTLNSGGGKDYLKRDGLLTSTSTWSKCGRDVILRINSRIRTLNNNSYMSVDSLDLKNGVIFHLQWRQCH